ncbi:hypothetical protein Anas_06795 [Armadillidium nasatum]|uniref:Uncharacterized protein n=1 Tax=Armadillidium nasatum TaxID=96803 RepID=A0A5N5TMQ8_9CRUS|nr:hypothetical protein Anas_06795 [Armadillidium nasatum]
MKKFYGLKRKKLVCVFQMGILPISVNFEENGSMKKYKSILIGSLAGFAVLVFLPFLHFGIIAHIWDEFNYKVNKKDCTCSCWDTVFKGIYDRGPAGYKHIYFNATSNSLKIWFSTVIFILLVYEGTKRAVKLLLAGSKCECNSKKGSSHCRYCYSSCVGLWI